MPPDEATSLVVIGGEDDSVLDSSVAVCAAVTDSLGAMGLACAPEPVRFVSAASEVPDSGEQLISAAQATSST
jgi:hypothetical protein